MDDAWRSRLRAVEVSSSLGMKAQGEGTECEGAECDLTADVRSRHFRSLSNTWVVDEELLRETDGELQPIINCAMESAAIVSIARNLRFKVNTPVEITTAVSLVGDMAGEGEIPSFTCNADNQILIVRYASRVLLQNLHFTDCSPADGLSPIEFVESRVVVRSCLFERNQADRGGAVLATANVTLRDSSFFDNAARREGGALFFSGAFSFRLLNCTFTDNRAGFGGCIAASNKARVEAGRCRFIRNSALSVGGVIYSRQAQELALEDTELHNNAAEHGGAVFVLSEDSREDGGIQATDVDRVNVTISNCTITSNTATRGGAIYADDAVSIWIERCRFELNAAAEHGGAIFLSTSGYDQIRSGSESSGQTEASAGNAQVLNLLRAASAVLEMDPVQHAGVAPRLTVRMDDVAFVNNTASNSGGALGADSGCFVLAERVSFRNNSATYFGAAFLLQSEIYCRDCIFENNAAVESAGALLVQGVQTTTFSRLPLARGYLRDCYFLKNRAGNYGGAVVVDGVSAFFSLLGNVTFQRNSARGGGALSSESTSTLQISDTRFIRNSASVGGGALALMFIQFRANKATLTGLTFIGNEAPVGGAIQAVFNVNAADEGVPRVSFDGNTVEPACVMRDVQLINNSAHRGGAIYFNGVPASFQNVSVRDNRAEQRGGGIMIMGGSVVLIVDASFTSNAAGIGGAIMVGVQTMLHCINCNFEENSAREEGGSICVITERYEPQPVAFQCDVCFFKRNRAAIGGACHIGYRPEQIDADPENDAFVILRRVEFSENEASTGGGAIMAAHPTNVLLTCDHQVTESDRNTNNITDSYATARDRADLQPLSLGNVSCASWERNGASGYGDISASYVSSAMTEIVVDGKQVDKVVVNRTASIPLLPPIVVFLLDAFSQKPAETRIEHQNLIVTIRPLDPDHVELSGQLNAPFMRGQAILNEVIIRGKPGTHHLMLNFSDGKTENVEIDLDIMPCPIGWFPVADNRACEKCETGTYNFGPDNGSCQACPDDGRCRFWGIEPRRKYWTPFPCSTKVQECLTEQACDHDGRAKDLAAFFNSTAPSCNISAEELKAFRDAQCNEGRGGPLCGSCMEGHGRRGLECHKCLSKGIIFVLFFLALAWFVIVVVVGVQGNLSTAIKKQGSLVIDRPNWSPGGSSEMMTTMSEQRSQSQKSSIDQRPSLCHSWFKRQTKSQASIGQCNTPRSLLPSNLNASDAHQQQNGVEMASRTSTSSPPRSQSVKTSSSTCQGSTSRERLTDKDKAKRQAAETFKLFINFGQVVSMAVAIDVPWKGGLDYFLKAIEFASITTAEASVSLECLFLESSSIPRTIEREILSLFFPLMLLAIFWSFWLLQRSMQMESRKKRGILSTFVGLYISYLGVTRRLIRILHCVKVTDAYPDGKEFEKRYWTEDTSVQCYTGDHLYLVLMLVFPLILLISIAFPFYSGWSLIRAEKNKRLAEQEETFGFMFRGYKEKHVYWDSIIMLRKALLVLIAGFGFPLGTNLQGILASAVLMFSMALHQYLRPFDEDTYGLLNEYESVSLLVSAITFSAGAVVHDGTVGYVGSIVISVGVLLVILAFVVCVSGRLCRESVEFIKCELKEHDRDADPDSWPLHRVLLTGSWFFFIRFLHWLQSLSSKLYGFLSSFFIDCYPFSARQHVSNTTV